MVANEFQKPVPAEVKLLDLVTRIVPSAFYLIVLIQKLNENYAFIVSSQASGATASSWKFFAEVVSRSSTILFLGLLTILFIIRLEPIKKAKGISPRVLAIAGTFAMTLVTMFREPTFLSRKQSLPARSVWWGLAFRSSPWHTSAAHLVLWPKQGDWLLRDRIDSSDIPLYVFEAVASLGDPATVFLVLYCFSYSSLNVSLQIQRMKNEGSGVGRGIPRVSTL
jgi:hypothetical protein